MANSLTVQRADSLLDCKPVRQTTCKQTFNNMKRTFLALMCIASLALMTACGNNNKEQNTDKTSESATESVEPAKSSAPESVTRTKWFYESENSTYRLTISVEDNANLFFTKYDDDGNLLDSGNLFGDVTYNNGEGSIPLGENGNVVDKATFTVGDKEMKFTFKGETVTMKQKSID